MPPPAEIHADPAPEDGSLPEHSLAGAQRHRLGIYVHVPFCRVRCGYCDFNTYTASELTRGGSLHGYVDAALEEIALAARVLAGGAASSLQPAPSRQVDTVFFGGGTPTMLPVDQLSRLLRAIDGQWPLASGAEVTTEANPDTVTPAVADALAAAGFTRVSLGMQSAVPHVLSTLDRTHEPSGVRTAVEAVRSAGMQVSLDLIYGTPGESLTDWEASLDAAVALRPDHLSAYALTIEPGTAMGAAVRRGRLARPSDDDEADKYELLDARMRRAGFQWYEISNWAMGPQLRSAHNMGYWRGESWWGIGPGAHSHVDGTRWWNVKHPAAYSDRLAAGLSPAHSREVLSGAQRHDEYVLLGLRLADGLSLNALSDQGRRAVPALVQDDLLVGRAAQDGRAALTLRGRLLADTVTHALLGAADTS
ncbi:MAG: radical SAM family heme chaperone HemW [Ornithinimicrobium sp.]